jgi:hypothetical protein
MLQVVEMGLACDDRGVGDMDRCEFILLIS